MELQILMSLRIFKNTLLNVTERMIKMKLVKLGKK